MKPGASPSIKSRALRYLSQREHSRVELERKLARGVEDSADAPAATRIKNALDELAAHDLQSDRRAAAAVVNAQAHRFGALKLRHTLRSRGIEPALAQAALAALPDSELERARALWLRKFGAPAADANGRARQARFLAGRGFDADVIRRVVRGVEDA